MASKYIPNRAKGGNGGGAAKSSKAPEGMERRRRLRNPAEDEHYQTAREAYKTADERRGPHQRAVENQTGGKPHWITRSQAAEALVSMGVLERDEKSGEVGVRVAGDVDQGSEDRIVHPDFRQHQEMQASGGLEGKLLRHYVKWLVPPAGAEEKDERRVTIALSPDEVKELNGHMKRGAKLEAYVPTAEEEAAELLSKIAREAASKRQAQK